jgi:hypothetical protein
MVTENPASATGASRSTVVQSAARRKEFEAERHSALGDDQALQERVGGLVDDALFQAHANAPVRLSRRNKT